MVPPCMLGDERALFSFPVADQIHPFPLELSMGFEVSDATSHTNNVAGPEVKSFKEK